MSRTIILMIISAVIGAFFVNEWHSKARIKEQLAHSKALAERDRITQELSREYYELYQDATTREPTVITERVLVKAKCPVPTIANAGVGDGADAARVELDSGTVRRVAALADRHQRLYEQCAIALRYHQQLNQKQ